jgi:hypothetical protein
MLDIVLLAAGWWEHNGYVVLNSVLLAAIDLEDLAAVKALTEGTWIRRNVPTFPCLWGTRSEVADLLLYDKGGSFLESVQGLR